LPGSLPRRGTIKVRQSLGARIADVRRGASIDLNRRPSRPQLQLIAHANATLGHNGFRQGDLKLPSDSSHDTIIAGIKDVVKDGALMTTTAPPSPR
jgi:hypothetical protein